MKSSRYSLPNEKNMSQVSDLSEFKVSNQHFIKQKYKRSNSTVSNKFGIINLTFDLEKNLPGTYNIRSSSLESNKLKKQKSQESSNQDEDEERRDSKVFVNLPTPDIRIFWTDLTFQVSKKVWKVNDCMIPSFHQEEKLILKPQSGELKAGTITGLMGPSGAGKSTLLNCITGRYNEGVGGEVRVTYPCDHKSLKVSFVPQKDHLFTQFTVKETLLFASKIKNPSSTYHDYEAEKVISNLNLEKCSDVKVAKCSGGQIKRVSIGVELISHPDVLVLDEPTSGLDSSNAESCIRLLRDLANDRGPAIVCTIHQPNYEIFTYFTNIYLLSNQGQNIYFGPPTDMLDYFSRFNIKRPEYVNPADYAIDVANGRFAAPALFEVMATHQRKVFDAEENLKITKESSSVDVSSSSSNSSSLVSASTIKTLQIGKVLSKSKNTSVSYAFQTILLFWRSLQVSCFRSPQLLARCVMNLVIAFLVSFMFTESTGIEDGCWNSATVDNHFNGTGSESDQLREAFLSNINKKDAKDEYLSKISRITDNTNFMFAVCTYILMVYSIGTVLIIPLELATAMKEMSNSWYRSSSYFIAKTFADLVPMIISIFCNIVIIYFATQQINEAWRFATTALIIILLSWSCESLGMLIGILLSNDLTAATLVTMAASFPTLIYSGYLVRIAAIPWFFVPMTYISHTRFAFEAVLVTIYGFGRCQGGEKASDFIDDLVAAKNPIDLVTTLWESFNITSNDASRFSAILGVDGMCMEEVVNATGDYLGVNLDGSSLELGTLNDTFVDEKPFQPSYVLSYFKLEEAYLYRSIICLGALICMFRLMTFIALQLKIKIKH